MGEALFKSSLVIVLLGMIGCLGGLLTDIICHTFFGFHPSIVYFMIIPVAITLFGGVMLALTLILAIITGNLQ